MPIVAIAMVAAAVAGGAIGASESAGDRARAAQALQDAKAAIDAVGAPPDLSYQIIYEKFQQAGILTPQLAGFINTQKSKVAGLKEDPSLRESQMNALQLLKQRAETGITPTDRAAYNQMRAQVQTDIQAKQQQIMQGFAQRGQAGSGSELAAQLSAAQQGEQIQSSQADEIAGKASQNALSALSQYGGMAGSVRGQDFSIAQAKAAAEDEFQRFNVSNQLNVQQQNVAYQNQALAYNLQNKQNLSNMNTQTANAEKIREVQAKEQYWQDQLSLASAKANVDIGIAPQYRQSANDTAKMWSGIGSSVSSGIGAAYGMGGGGGGGGGGNNFAPSNMTSSPPSQLGNSYNFAPSNGFSMTNPSGG